MKKLVLVAALALPLVALAKDSNVKPGQWHIKVTHEMQGAPFTPPATELDKCITPEQASDPKSMQNKDSEPADVKIDGNKVTYKITCHSHGGTQTGVGEMTYKGDSYSGTMTVAMDNPRFGHMKMINHVTGTRTGDCK